jgi:hypothetical protein
VLALVRLPFAGIPEEVHESLCTCVHTSASESTIKHEVDQPHSPILPAGTAETANDAIRNDSEETAEMLVQQRL